MKIPKSDGRFKKGDNLADKHHAWKGDNASYYAIHIWLKNNYGKANKCDNSSCISKSKRFEWALIKFKEHSHNRDNYRMLCKPCHTRYDEINLGEKSYLWKGGKPKCLDCPKLLSRRFNKTMLCISCKNKKYPSRKKCVSQNS